MQIIFLHKKKRVSCCDGSGVNSSPGVACPSVGTASTCQALLLLLAHPVLTLDHKALQSPCSHCHAQECGEWCQTWLASPSKPSSSESCTFVAFWTDKMKGFPTQFQLSQRQAPGGALTIPHALFSHPMTTLTPSDVLGDPHASGTSQRACGSGEMHLSVLCDLGVTRHFQQYHWLSVLISAPNPFPFPASLLKSITALLPTITTALLLDDCLLSQTEGLLGL